MSKYDPQYDVFLIDIPVNFTVRTDLLGNKAIIPTRIENDISGKKIYDIPDEGNMGVIREYGDLMSQSVWNNVIYNSHISMAFDTMDMLFNVNPNNYGYIRNIDDYLTNQSGIPTPYSIFKSSIDNVYSVTSWFLRNYDYETLYSSAKSLMLSIPDISNIVNSINIGESEVNNYVTSYQSILNSIQSQINSSISNYSNSVNTLVSSLSNHILSNIPNYIQSYLNSTQLLNLINSKLSGLVSSLNLSTYRQFFNTNYTTDTNQLAPFVDSIAQYYLSSIDTVKRNYFSGHERFAGKRIGMTNVVDVYATRQIVKTIAEVKVSLYDRLLNAINNYHAEIIKNDYDVIKILFNFLSNSYIESVRAYISNSKDYVDAIRTVIASLSDIPKAHTNVYSSTAGALSEFVRAVVSKLNVSIQKYGTGMSFLGDIYKNASITATTLTDKSMSLIPSTYNDFAKLYISLAHLRTQTCNEQAKMATDRGAYLMNISTQYMQNVLYYYGYRYDRALELMSHFAGIPNTIQRGLSKFEQWMAPISLVLNTVTSVGSMILPFI